MSCPDFADLIEVELELGTTRIGPVWEHVQSCRSCTDRLDLWRRQRSLIASVLERVPLQRAGNKPPAECPDWESLAAYADDSSCLQPNGEQMSAHVDRCQACLLTVARFRVDRMSGPAPFPILPETPVRLAASRDTRGYPGWLIAVPALAAAVLLLVVAPALWLRKGPSRIPPGPTEQAQVKRSPEAGKPPVAPGTREIAGVHPPQSAIGNGGVSAPPGPAGDLSPEIPPVLYRQIPPSEVPLSITLRVGQDMGTRSILREIPILEDSTPTLKSGEHFRFDVAVKKNLWLYIFQEDSQGHLATLFPNPGFRTGDNPVLVGSAASSIPPVTQAGFELDKTVGLERVYIFYATSRQDRCDRLASLLESHATDAEVRQILRELVRTAGPRNLSQPIHAAVTFTFRHEE